MILENGVEVEAPVKNKIIGSYEGTNVKIVFNGEGNILFLDEEVRMTNSTISFMGDKALVFLSRNTKNVYHLKIDAWRETCVYFGEESYFNGILNLIISERQSFFAGNDCLFSFGIWIRTADPHLIYDMNSMKRINMSESILVGDHVWIGQNALLLKGSRIGSGSIISAASVLSHKKIESNSIYGGNPARRIKTNAFFLSNSAHNFTKEKTKASMSHRTNQFIYAVDGQTIDFGNIEKLLSEAKNAEDRLELLKTYIVSNKAHNRFASSSSRTVEIENKDQISNRKVTTFKTRSNKFLELIKMISRK